MPTPRTHETRREDAETFTPLLARADLALAEAQAAIREMRALTRLMHRHPSRLPSVAETKLMARQRSAITEPSAAELRALVRHRVSRGDLPPAA